VLVAWQLAGIGAWIAPGAVGRLSRGFVVEVRRPCLAAPAGDADVVDRWAAAVVAYQRRSS